MKRSPTNPRFVTYLAIALVLLVLGLASSTWYNQGQVAFAQEESSTVTYVEPELGFALLYPSDMFYRKWNTDDGAGEILASTSFYADSAKNDGAFRHPEVGIAIFANPQHIPVIEWAKRRADPQNIAALPAGTRVYRNIVTDLQELTVGGHKAVMFAEDLGYVAGRLLIEDGDRIISIIYTDFGDGQMKSAFPLMAASFTFSDTPAVDPQLQQQVAQIISGYPSPSSEPPSPLPETGSSVRGHEYIPLMIMGLSLLILVKVVLLR